MRRRAVESTIDGWVAAPTFPTRVFRERLPFDDSVGPGWDLEPPASPTPPPNPPEDPVVPFRVILRGPRNQVLDFDRPRASELLGLPFAGGRPTEDARRRARGRWQLTVLNTGVDGCRIEITVNAVNAVIDHLHRSIPLSLLNNLGAVALKKTALTIAYQDGNLHLETPTHFLGLLGAGTEFGLPGLAGMLLEATPTFTPLRAVVESRRSLVARLEARKRELELAHWPNHVPPEPADWIRVKKVMDAEIARARDARGVVFCIVLEGMFSDASIDLNYVGKAVDVDNKLPQIAYLFNERAEVVTVVSTLAFDLSPVLSRTAGLTVALASLAAAFGSPVLAGLIVIGGATLYNSIDQELEEELRSRLNSREVRAAVGSYVKALIERVAGYGALMTRCELSRGAAADRSDTLDVSYCDPASAVAIRPLDIAIGENATDPVTVAKLAMRSAQSLTLGVKPGIRTSAVLRRVDGVPASRPRRSLPGPYPVDFVVNQPATLDVLDRHQCIVVLMMENRSFDHYFFDLANEFPGRGYEPGPVAFTNPPPIGYGEPVTVQRNDAIGIGHSLIFWEPEYHGADPSHSYEHTMFQIGGGTPDTCGTGEMLGFARDFARGSDSPQIVMGYFGLDSLPSFRAIADRYAVCNRWFASLPVGTQPNRLSVFQGDVPFLHNVHMDDPSLGFLEDASVFDVLNRQGIEWEYFEGDIGTIRLYDRYRLDVEHVHPYSEMRARLKAARDSGRLPRVVFVEPEFLFGNDDHPPMDVRDGQEFVRDAIGTFLDLALLDRTLFVITYDEHGGYFDHVAPPGTPRGDPAYLGRVPGMFPTDPAQAPDSMGVRVPSMVLSEYVSPRASSVVLDHTSILRTILLHNRDALATDHFSMFGERVKQGSHLGEVLDLRVARAIDYQAFARDLGHVTDDTWLGRRASRIVNAVTGGLDATHSGRVLHNIVAPRAKRYVSV